MANDPYQELGVSRSASADEIRKSFRKLAKQLHPDQNPGDKAAEERFKRVSGAFDLLGDPAKKARFDRGEIDADGHEAQRGYDPRQGGFGGGAGRGGFGGGGAGGPGGGFGAQFEGVDLEDILGGCSVAAAGRAVPAGVPAVSAPGAEPTSVRGWRSTWRRRSAAAPSASPSPTVVSWTSTSQRAPTTGRPCACAARASPGAAARGGDALIEIAIRPHPVYRREGSDLHMDLPVTLYDAVLGAKVQAPTPDGEVSLSVPKLSTSGAVLRLKGRGAVDGPTGRRGDLFAKLMVALPEGDDELQAFAEAMKRDRPYTPRRR